MPIVGEAEILIVANDSAFNRSLRAGTAPGFRNLATDADHAGTDAGRRLAGGLGAGGSRGGEEARRGAKDGLGRVSRDAEAAGKDGGSKFANGIRSALGGLSGLLGGVGLDLGPLEQSLDRSGEKIGNFETKGAGIKSTIAGIGRTTAIAGTVGFLAFGAAAVNMATKFQASTATMAAAANIPIQQANAIGDAFLHEGANIVFSANEQEQAFSTVAAQLQAVQGHALTTSQSVKFMRDSMDLAEESGTNLSSTTQDLSQVMQTFQVPLAQTSTVTTALFNASRITNVSIDSLTGTMDKLKARLGVAAPTVSDMSTLIVDLGQHGVTGSRGLMVVNTAITTLLSSTGKLDAAQQKNATATAAKVQSAQQAVANATLAVKTAEDKAAASSGKSAATQQAAADAVTKAKLSLQQAQSKLSDAEKSGTQISNANVAAAAALGIQVYDAQGKFIGMRDVIAQLQPKLEHMTQQQQLQALASVFGASANKSLLDVVLAGPAAYDKASKAVNDQQAAKHALETQEHTLQHELESTKTSVENITTAFGLDLLPAVQQALGGISDFIGFLDSHKPVLYAFGAVIGTFLVGAMLVWIYTVGEKMVASTRNAIDGIGKLFGAGKQQAQQAQRDAASNAQAAQRTQTSIERAAQVFQQAASAMERAAAVIENAFAGIGRSAQGAASEVGAAASEVEASVSAMTASTEGELAGADAAFAGLGTAAEAAATEVAAADTEMEASNAAASESRLAGGVGGAGGGMGKLGQAGLLATAGYTAYQTTSQILGDPSHPTGAGRAVGGAAGAVANLLGVGPAQTATARLGSQLSGGSEANLADPTSMASLLVQATKGQGPLARVDSPTDARTILHKLGVPGYDIGGYVDAPTGAPILAVIHGGEYVLSAKRYATIKAAMSGQSAISHALSPSPARGRTAESTSAGRQAPGLVVEKGAVQQTFNTPMNAPQVANEVGWTLRTAPVTGLRGPR